MKTYQYNYLIIYLHNYADNMTTLKDSQALYQSALYSFNMFFFSWSGIN